jgi:hypothetical protein
MKCALSLASRERVGEQQAREPHSLGAGGVNPVGLEPVRNDQGELVTQ